MPSTLRNHTHHLDKRLRFRLRIYFLISIILIGIFFFIIFRGALRIDLGIIGIAVGIVIGIFTSRMFHTSWDKNAKKVVSRLDVYGVIILILYIAFEISRERIVGFITHDFETGTIGFAVLTGIMFGRIIGTRGRIIDVLREQKIFK